MEFPQILNRDIRQVADRIQDALDQIARSISEARPQVKKRRAVWEIAQDAWKKTKDTFEKAFSSDSDTSGSGSRGLMRSGDAREADDEYEDIFRSREWKEFFAHRPWLDRAFWKTYVQQELRDPMRWKEAVESQMPKFEIDRPNVLSPLRQPLIQQPPTVAEIVTINEPYLPMSNLLGFICLLLSCTLAFRVMKARQSANIAVGDGTVELINLARTNESEAEEESNYAEFSKPILHMRRMLELSRLFHDTLQLPLICLLITEQQNCGTLFIAISSLILLIPMLILGTRDPESPLELSVYNFYGLIVRLAIAGLMLRNILGG